MEVANAFGAMSNRPALFLRISADDGAWGWGEVFCNFPQVGAEHRARLIVTSFLPEVLAEFRRLDATLDLGLLVEDGPDYVRPPDLLAAVLTIWRWGRQNFLAY